MHIDNDVGGARNGWRTTLQILIAVLGLTAIVGSGGGFVIGFPDCIGDSCYWEPPLPPPVVLVQPSHITALVGTPVSFTAETYNTSSPLSYQWRRSSDGGVTYLDIPGATSKTYTLAGVNLSDDGVQFQVVVHGSTGFALNASGQLAVSAVPGLVFEDGEFLPANWLAVIVRPDLPEALHSELRLTTGGNPGAYRRMVFQLPQGAGAVSVGYASVSATYAPQSQGSIYVIDYAEDCLALQSSETMSTQSGLLIEQGGRSYRSESSWQCVSSNWSAVANRSSLRAQDLLQIDGPACQAGESCPDFSASAAPMRFGYWRISYGVPRDSIAHGIDNWKVTVWRR